MNRENPATRPIRIGGARVAEGGVQAGRAALILRAQGAEWKKRLDI